MNWEAAVEQLIATAPLVAYVVWRLEGRVRRIDRAVQELRRDVHELRRRSDPPPPREDGGDRADATPLESGRRFARR